MRSVYWMALVWVFGVTAQAGQEVGNGGDACKQSILVVRDQMVQSLKAQGQEAYPEFDFQTLGFFLKKTKIEIADRTFDENKQETDASSNVGSKLIQLSRARWCPKPDKIKAALLFHEFLVVMEIERTDFYDVSSRFVFISTAEEQKREQKRWVCTVPAFNYRCLVGNDVQYCFGGQNNIHSPKYFTVSAAAPDESFNQAIAAIEEYNRRSEYNHKVVACYRLQHLGDTRYYCSEPVTIANSCVRVF